MNDRDPTGEPPHVEVFPMAIGAYDHHDSLDVDSEVTRVADLLAEFGGEITTPWDIPMPQRGSDAVGARLGSWSRSAGGHTVMHWVGHGWSDRDRAALAHARSPRHVGTEGVSPERLADHITDREARSDAGAPWLIVIVDACKSARFVELLSAALDARQGPRRVLLVGTSAAGSTTLGRLSAALDTVLRDMFAADEEIEFSELWRELKRNLPGSAVIPKNVENAALRRRVLVPAGFSVPLDVRADVQRVLAELPEDERRHFVPKAQGAELGEVSWYFEGREDERRRIVDWLRGPSSGLRVVTGRAGSGKSALLGDVLVRSRPDLSRVLIEHGLLGSLPESDSPPPGVVDTAVHLTGLTPADVIDRLSIDLRLGDAAAAREKPLSTRIDALTGAIRDRAAAATILVDALDEAADPLTVAAVVLRPLAAIPGVRVVVGTRRSTHEGPDQPEPDDQNLIDALGADHTELIEVSRDPAAISRYARRRLDRGLAAQRPNIEPTTIDAVGDAIAAAGREFLFARLAVHELLARPELLTDPLGLTGLLSGDHRSLFVSAVARLRRRRPAHGPLLRALAHARGRGLPMRDGVWAAIAAALTDQDEVDRAVSDADISVLLDDAAPYLMIDAEHGQTVYRLAHRTFVEHFITDHDATIGAHRAIARRCRAEIMHTRPGVLNPYLATYTSAHTGAGGREAWQDLAATPDVLDRLDPSAVAGDAMRTAFGRFPLPPEIAGVIGAHHLLREASSSDRPGIRQLAMTRHSGTRRPGQQPRDGTADWGVSWADLRRQPVHLTLTGHMGGVTAICPLPGPDGRTLLATGGDDGTVRVWEPATGTPVGGPLTGHTGGVVAVCALPDPGGRTLLATGGDDGTVRVWEPATGTPVGGPLTGHTGGVVAVCALPVPGGHMLLASGGWDGTVRVWEPATGAPVGGSLTGHTGGVVAVCALPDPGGRTLLATAGFDGTVRIWDPATGTPVGGPLTGHTGPVGAVCALPGPGGRTLLATGHWFGAVRIWDPATGAPIGEPLTGHTSGVGTVCALPGPGGGGRTLLAAGGGDGAVRIWDPTTGAPIGEPLTGHTGPVLAVWPLPGPDGRTLLATAGDDATVRIWDPTTGAPIGEPLTGHTGWVWAVCALPGPGGRTLLASGGDDATVRVWDPATGAPVGEPLTGHNGDVVAVCALPGPGGRTLLASGGTDGTVRIWDPATGAPVGEPLTGHTSEVGAVCALPGPGGRTLLATAGGLDGTVRIWDPATGAPVGEPLTGHTGGVGTVCALPGPGGGGRTLLAIGGADGTVRIWDPATASAPVGEPLTGHTHPVTAVCALPGPDGHTLLATGGADGTVRIWDPATGIPVGGPLTGHTGRVGAVCALSGPDGHTLLATGGADGTVRIWDPTNGAVARIIPLGTSIHGIAVVDSNHLAVALEEGIAVLQFAL